MPACLQPMGCICSSCDSIINELHNTDALLVSGTWLLPSAGPDVFPTLSLTPGVPFCMCRVSPIPDYCSQAQRRNPIRVPLNATTVTWGYLCEFVRAVPMFMLLVNQWTDVYGWVPNGQGYAYPGVADVALYQNYLAHKSVSLTDLGQKVWGHMRHLLGQGSPDFP